MYQVRFSKTASKNIKKIDSKYQKLILQKLRLLAENPFNTTNVKALKGEENFYRLRVANYRVVYELKKAELIILVIDINHRKDIY